MSWINRGFCYIGLNEDDGTLHRPIPTDAPSQCCWPSDCDMEVGKTYQFQEVMKDVDTEYPHKNDDFLVKSDEVNKVERVQTRSLFQQLKFLSQPTLVSLFGQNVVINPNTHSVYVNEGEMCASYGILRIERSSVNFENQYNKDLLIVRDNDGCLMKLSWTSVEQVQKIEAQMARTAPGDEVLVFIGLGRGFSPQGKFNPPRCYALGLGVFFDTSGPSPSKKRRN